MLKVFVHFAEDHDRCIAKIITEHIEMLLAAVRRSFPVTRNSQEKSLERVDLKLNGDNELELCKSKS